ncbi:hypothetical protein REPUB_Repub01dG0172800 [Reevesia pubescens]
MARAEKGITGRSRTTCEMDVPESSLMPNASPILVCTKNDDLETVLEATPKFHWNASSSEIHEALKDEQLQKLISDIDRSPDAMNELDKAMGVDVFHIFSDKILSTINP